MPKLKELADKVFGIDSIVIYLLSLSLACKSFMHDIHSMRYNCKLKISNWISKLFWIYGHCYIYRLYYPCYKYKS